MSLKKEKKRPLKTELNLLRKEHESIKDKITRRLEEFKKIWLTGSNEDIFYELIFCLMTPQSKAVLCWEATENIRKRDITLVYKPYQIQPLMTGVRFKYKKSEYILEARDKFLTGGGFVIKSLLEKFDKESEKRDWLVKNIKGLGFKEAGHFLRNIGFGDSLAILDRHILKNLKRFNVIRDYPVSLSTKKYLEIEKKMLKFSEKISIPPKHLDLLFWYREAGTVFK